MRSFERLDELLRQPGLADSRLAVNRDEVGATIANGALERVLEQLELVLAADERRFDRVRAPSAVGHADRGPDPDRLAAAANVKRTDVLEDDPAEGQAAHSRADQKLLRSGCLLQTGGDVDRLPGREG